MHIARGKEHSRKHSGITLIELMIVLVVLSILVGIAYPGYQQFVQRARRSEAQIALTQTAAALEKYFTACSSYSLNLASLKPTAANCLTSGTASTKTSDDNNYTISVAPDTSGNIGVDYKLTATATATGKQKSDKKCKTLTLSSTGVKTSADSGGGVSTSECWRK